jgi:hypothetical protein
MSADNGGCLMVFLPMQVITSIMSLVRWFTTDHYAFWHGLKELIWALIPIVNFTYVWDWWFSAFAFVIAIAIMFFEWLQQ